MQRLGARRRVRLVRLTNGTLSRSSRPLATAQRDDSSSPRGRYRSRLPSRRSPAQAARSRQVRVPAAGTPSLLAAMAGKQRLWIISAPHAADGYYRLMLSLLKDDVYCELAERHIYQLVLFHQDGEMGGKVRKITNQGTVLEEPLDARTVLKLLDFLKLERGKFSMVLLRKNLQLEETYPYPVRLEAMYEVIDQGPIRKIERLRQKGFVQKCKQAGVEGKVIGPTEGQKRSEEKLRPTPTNENVEVPSPKETLEEKVSEKRKKTTTVSPDYAKEQTVRHKYNRSDKKTGNYHKKGPRVTPILRKPTKTKPPKSKNTNNKILINEYEDKYDSDKTSSTDTGQEVEGSRIPLKKGKEQKKHGKPVKNEKKKKPVKKDKAEKKIKPVLKTKPLKEAKHKNPKKANKKGIFKLPKKFPGMPKTLASILSHFENRRRLI
eukprot:g46071.t1